MRGSVHQPNTIFSKINAVQPGEFGLLKLDGEKTFKKFVDISSDVESYQFTGSSYQDQCDEISKAFQVAVKRNLVADVEVGAFLSGGVDSSAVVGVMASLSDKPIRTYYLGYEGQEGKVFDE